MLAILLLTRRIADAPVEERPKLDVVGSVSSALGLERAVFGVLPHERVGLDRAEARRPVLGQPLADRVARPRRPAVIVSSSAGSTPCSVRRRAHDFLRPDNTANRQLSGGLTMFFEFLVQAGIFFVVPLYLSVCLGLSGAGDGSPAAAAVRHVARGRDRNTALFSNRLRG